VAAIAAIQLGAVTFAFISKTARGWLDNGDDGAHRPPLKIDVDKLGAESSSPGDPLGLGPDPLSTSASLSPIKPELASAEAGPLAKGPVQAVPVPPPNGTGVAARPTPVPLSAFTPKTDPRLGELVEQGKLLRNSGDTAGALVKFREAGAMDPGNPLPIAEQAFTFEKMSLPDKAADQWRRILVMGERAGAYFSAAKAKLDSAMQTTIRETAGGGTELPPGKTMGLGAVTMAEDSDPSVSKKFTLGVPIRARLNEPVSVRDMKVFVLFYEKVNGKDIARTTANVGNRWSSPPADWRDGDTETLEVTYELPAQTARSERREYFGYIVRLYYRGELQDTHAEPANLNQKFPAPYTLSE
jgi:hypothetical protein